MEDLIDRAAKDLAKSEHAIALTGAGMSTESGIQDFRGPQGLWTLNKDAEAKAYQRYELFLANPRAYWEEMLGTAQGTHGAFYVHLRDAEPNPGHLALAELEAMGRLKSVLTQNVDGLHDKAGNKHVISYHGNIHRLRCHACGARFGLDEISLDELPPQCRCGGTMKYDVVHFKEAIPEDVQQEAEREAWECDLMLICGTSAVVYPFASLPRMARMRGGSRATIIEVNAEPTPLTQEGVSDYLIQGKTGEILPQIVERVKTLA
jgi:NAD-dependent deacetylase